MDRCEECGYEYAAVARDEISSSLRRAAEAYAARLIADPAVLRAHPFPDTWSALEYGCHIRDIFRVQRERIRLALAEDVPVFASMRREERVHEERYNEQDPVRVSREIGKAVEALGGELDALDEGGWQRTGVYNWPTTEVRTVEWIGRHTLHEARHHLMDIDRLLGPP